ncbi:MAG: ATP-binding protein, partial [Chloroflexota bacterium]
MTDDTPQIKPDSAENTGGSTNVNNTTQGGIGIGEGSQITVGQGDITGRDKKTAGGHIIEAAAGATVIIGAAPVAEEEAPAPGEPPFKGLQYFDEKDAEWFFGRELLVAKLVGKLRDNRFLAIVIGASGSGKSSIVRAGVIPALKRGDVLADGSLPPQGSARWPIHIITPTIRPLESLAASLTRDSESVTATTTLMDDLARDSRSLHLAARKALSRNPASHLLIVVDQFEELFTLCKDEAERKAFIDNLITATDPKTDGPTIVVVTMRADFYANCAAYSNLREVLSSQQEYI